MHLEWTATVAGREKRLTAEITDQTSDTRIAWAPAASPGFTDDTVGTISETEALANVGLHSYETWV